MKLKLRTLLLSIIVSVYATESFALRIYLEEWRDQYPESTSDQIGTEGCQLCHAGAGGGSPWNAYGWQIRQIFNVNGGDIEEAIQEAAEIDLDEDPSSRLSLDEINYNFQPGWTAGPNNTIYFANGSTDDNQLPPELSGSPNTALDWPENTDIQDPIPGEIPPGLVSVATAEVAGEFNAPVKAVKAPGINGSLFVVEQTGRIFRTDLSTGEKTLFHDVSADLVELSDSYDERGLLGLAFHPNFANNGLFYTYHSEAVDSTPADFPILQSVNHRSVLNAYRVADSSCNAAVSDLGPLLVIDQPQSNHNGGDIVFGPDGYLYISLGDGGGADDTGSGHGLLGNGRNPLNPLGAILRIDPDGTNSDNGRYGIPSSNPFANATGVDEIFAYGFRNPYRMSFDALTGELYAADVGQNDIEEIDLVELGGDYGWNRKEGTFYFYKASNDSSFISTVAPPAQPANLIDPIAEYDRFSNNGMSQNGRSVTGGYVYRGDRIPGLSGRYVFADYFNKLYYLDENNGVSRFMVGSDTSDFVAGFAQDADNELYIVTNETSAPVDVTGRLLKLTALGVDSPPPSNEGESAQCPLPPPDDSFCVPIKASNGNLTIACL